MKLLILLIFLINSSAFARDDIFSELKLFSDIIHIVKNEYVNEVDNKELINGAIKGLVSNLDPHSNYLDPDLYKELQVETKGEFAGLGIEISKKENDIVIVSPMSGSPAEKVGVLSGDIIKKVNGIDITDLSLMELVKKLRGKKGTSVKISVLRKDAKELIEFKITRNKIKLETVKAIYLGDGFGYIRLNQFAEDSEKKLRKGLTEIKNEIDDKKIKGLIFDLRNNPGGLLNQAVKVTDIFLDKGLIVYTKTKNGKINQKFEATRKNTQPKYPLIILINHGSASASEIVSASLQGHSRATLLGTQTFGKGSVQTVTPLNNGGAISLTTALYYSVNDKSIQATGVKPDIEINLILNDQENEDAKLSIKRESQLSNSISNPNGVNDPSKSKEENFTNIKTLIGKSPNIKDWIKKDNQFRKAFELLKTYKNYDN